MRFDEYGHNIIDGRDLDNYITGHYGEDQFQGDEEESEDIIEIVYDTEDDELSGEDLVYNFEKLVKDVQSLRKIVLQNSIDISNLKNSVRALEKGKLPLH